ncbi:hypothetical protein ACFQY4_30670 [Catellatospora bangladeshensis]|nr:hypothetical protein [Catellatospora bangladeshensis]
MSGPRFVPPAEDFEPPADAEPLHQPPAEPADPSLPPIGLDEYGPDMGQPWEDRPPGGSP